MSISTFQRLWFYSIPLIPSILVSIFVLYHFLINRTLRSAINNHVIILLLSCGLIQELTDGIFFVHYYRTGTALISTPAFCFAWIFISAIAYTSIFILMAWASIERHILIFYPNLVATKTKRFFFHYLPLVTCILYPALFYFVVFFILPCNVRLDYNARFCGIDSCLFHNDSIALWDSIGHVVIPAFITIIFSVGLLIRVIYCRYRIRQRIQWRNYRKMASQLLSISLLYFVLQFPPMIMYTAYSLGLSPNIGVDYYNTSFFFTTWIVLFTPFASAVSLPNLRMKCRNIFFCWQRRHIVRPETIAVTNRNIAHIVAKLPTVK